MISTFTVQRVLEYRGFYDGLIDGVPGPKTHAALKGACLEFGLVGLEQPKDVAIVQLHLRMIGIEVGPIDGVLGRKTDRALKQWYKRNISQGVIPYEVEVPEWYGERGSNQRLIELPYTMRLSWEPTQTVDRMSCHAYVAPLMESLFYNVRKHYGLKRISELKLDLFGGCLNVRKKRGGNTWSMHSWGIAVDLDPEGNPLRANSRTARFAGEEYNAFWRIVDDHGAQSYGEVRNKDWQHFQFAAFK